MPKEAYSSSLAEYWYNVSSRDDIPIAGSVNIESGDLDEVMSLFTELNNQDINEHLLQSLTKAIVDNPNIVRDVLPFIGIKDKSFYLEMSLRTSRIPHPTKENVGISGDPPWGIVRHTSNFFIRKILMKGASNEEKQCMARALAQYLLDNGLDNFVELYSSLSLFQFESLHEAMIVSGDTQKEAKRRGHGAEGELAKLVVNVGCAVLPKGKEKEPMKGDVNLDKKSLKVVNKEDDSIPCDIVITKEGSTAVLILSMIHTSDPGQYGVDKADRAVGYGQSANNAGKDVEFWLLLDGVGFSENVNGTIAKLLKGCDCFIQINTLYKAALKLHSLGLCKLKGIRFSEGVYDSEDIARIKKLYVPADVPILTSSDADPAKAKAVVAGRATVYVSN